MPMLTKSKAKGRKKEKIETVIIKNEEKLGTFRQSLQIKMMIPAL